MPNRSAGHAEDRPGSETRDVEIVPDADGGFRLESPDGRVASARRIPEGWSVSVSSSLAELLLRRCRAGEAGFVLGDAEDDERFDARTSHLLRPGAGPISVVLSDGRVFWFLAGAADEPAYRVEGWEVPGAYWTASRRGERWRLERTAAGEQLDGVEPMLVVLAAELLDRDEGALLEPGREAPTHGSDRGR